MDSSQPGKATITISPDPAAFASRAISLARFISTGWFSHANIRKSCGVLFPNSLLIKIIKAVIELADRIAIKPLPTSGRLSVSLRD
jgi:hypothetical protein